MRHAGGEGAYSYSLGPGDDDAVAYSRFFNPVRGIAADPATGTAAGPLAALLVRSGPAAEGTVVIEQGRALGRPSRIQVSVTGRGLPQCARGGREPLRCPPPLSHRYRSSR
jgi:PhzF family phenazine biosynthesis protein